MGEFLDSLIGIGILIVSALPFAMSETIGGITLTAGFLIATFHLLFADGLSGGQSYGKRMAGTAVIDATTGKPCTFGQSLLRNCLLSLLGPIDWVFIFGNKRQRLGDKAANTIVVKV
jgi:uncharacterized RDD family membrane protein YckC